MKCYHLLNQIQHVGPKSMIACWICLVGPRPVKRFSTSCLWSARKKTSQYSSVDTDKYSSLVSSVVSSRTSSQTPGSLEEEDGQLYGPVLKSKSSSQSSLPKAHRNLLPLLNDSKTLDPIQVVDQMPPARIALPRGAGKSAGPSVTRILQQTMPPEQAFYLERWRKRMISELGEEGFKEYTLNIFRQGRLFHSALEAMLMSEDVPVEGAESPEVVVGYIESVHSILEDISGVKAIESGVQHQSLHYVGLVDCVAQYRGKLCVIDWKTSEKPKPFLHNTYDNPLQVAAYIGALNSDENYNYQVENGMIVVAYKDGSPADCHFMNYDLCLEYWAKWLLRLEEFEDKK